MPSLIGKLKNSLSISRRQPPDSRMSHITHAIRRQNTNSNRGQVQPLNQRGLIALSSVLSTDNKSSSPDKIQLLRSGRSHSSRSSDSLPISLSGTKANNDAIIEKLNLITIKMLIAVSLLIGNISYLTQNITNSTLFSTFQITMYVFYTCVNKIELAKNNDSTIKLNFRSILKIINDKPNMIGGSDSPNMSHALKAIEMLINTKSIPFRNAIIALFVSIFFFILLKGHENYDSKGNELKAYTKKKLLTIAK